MRSERRGTRGEEEEEDDFDPLRDRDDFKKLLAEVEAKEKDAKPAQPAK